MALVSAAVVKDTKSQVALVSDDDLVSTAVFASLDGRNVLVKLNTTQTVISIETSFTR